MKKLFNKHYSNIILNGVKTMKKILLFMTVMTLTLALASCDFLGDQTTTETETTVEVDYENYIDIDTIDALQNMEVNKSYRLTANLDLIGIEWTPIGSYEEPFLGHFDGNGFAISNITVSSDNIHNGLFGYMEGDVIDLTIENINISYETNFLTYVGGIAGYSNGAITGCVVEGDIDITNTSGNSFVGLLVGVTQGKLEQHTLVDEFYPNLIDNNEVTGTINLVSDKIGFVGGLIGKAYNSTVSNNISRTQISVEASAYPSYIGGLIGHNYGGILIGFEELIDETTIYIKNNISFTDIVVELEDSNVIVGGFIGYNQKGYNLDNYVKSTITLNGSLSDTNHISIGGYLGENWTSQIDTILIDSTLINNLTSTYSLSKGAVIGALYSDYTDSDVYLVIPTSFDTTQLSTDTAENIYTTNFFTNTLGWTQEVLDEITE
jgi:hypothetical protein